MKHHPLIIAMTLLGIISCSKDSRDDIKGDWTVLSIQVQNLTSNTDSGWNEQMAFSYVFFKGETLSIGDSYIIPCPSADSMLGGYGDYEGKIKYAYSTGGELYIPDAEYTQSSSTDDGFSFSQIRIIGGTYLIHRDGNFLELTTSIEETDNLGNVKKRTNAKIRLQKAD